ncbi:hypothetical protein CSOJ01_08684 [Colletotrichum sojae]|uniref:Uncharacterized protein n=1 Tax=Colletotrichum sojae TaxID=2175907 RepID=A0A8H6J624_9PEZI|nr:hypothetical protein CSOJ01_08684 [Colletotrichum sojae]
MNTTDGCRIAGVRREHYLRFEVPFISYETDTIAIYGLWSAADVRLTATAWKPMLVGDHFLRAPFEDLGEAAFDPLAGFDLKRIKRLAVGEDIVHLAEHPNGPLIDPAAMPSLKIVYTLFYGLSTHPDAFRRAMRMFPPEIQNCGDCYVDFDPCTEYLAAVEASPLRHQSQRRAISYASQLSRILATVTTSLESYLLLLKAVFWHLTRNINSFQNGGFFRNVDFVFFAIKQKPTRICRLPHCTHTFQAMASSPTQLQFQVALLWQDSWRVWMDAVNATEITAASPLSKRIITLVLEKTDEQRRAL